MIGPHGTPILDDFNRPDGPVGANWVDVLFPGAFFTNITDGAVFIPGGLGNGKEGYGVGWSLVPPCEVYVSVELGANDTGNDLEVGLLTTDAIGYVVGYDPRKQIAYMGKYSSPTFGDFVELAAERPDFTLESGDRLAVSFDGSRVTTWLSKGGGAWSALQTAEDPSPLSGPFNPYIFSNLNNTTFDDVGGGAFVLPSPKTSYIVRPKLEIAFTDNPLDALSGLTWEDVSDRLIEGTWSRGRQFELDRMEAGRATFVLDNTDRALDPTYTGSPYYPNVLPNKRIRLSLGENVMTNPRAETDASEWSAWISSGTASLSRVLDAPSDVELGDTCFEAAVNATLDGAASQVINTTIDVTPSLGLHVAPGDVIYGRAFMKLVSGGCTQIAISARQFDASNNLIYQQAIVVVASPTVGQWYDLAGTYTIPQAAVTGGVPVAYVSLELEIDGLPVGDTVYRGTATQLAMAPEDGSTPVYVDAPVPVFTGYVDRWPPTYEGPDEATVSLEATDAFDLYAHADLTGTFVADTTGGRVGDVLDALGWPAADRTIDTGQSNIIAKTYADEDGQATLAELQTCEEAEQGAFFMSGGGLATFHDRLRRQQAPYTTALATFADDGTEFPYEVVLPDFDKELITNQAKVTVEGTGATQTDLNTASKDTYGRRTRTLSVPLTADADGLALAQAIVLRHKDPQYRFDRISHDLTLGEQEVTGYTLAVLAREISDRVRIVQSPTPAGSPQNSAEVHVEKIGGSVKEDVVKIEWQLSPADTTVYLSLDAAAPDGALDSASLAF